MPIILMPDAITVDSVAEDWRPAQRQEVVVGRSGTISIQLYDDEARADSSTDVTIALYASDGEVILPPGTATTNPAGTVGRYERTLTPGQLAEIDLLTAVWTVTLGGVVETRRTKVEIVGGHYFELAELRAMPGLGDVAKFPTADLAKYRTEAQDEVERKVGVALVERYGERIVNPTNSCTIRLHPFVRRILGGTTDGTVFTAEQLEAMTAYESGSVVWTSVFTGTVAIRFVHAYTATPPSEMKDMALELARRSALGWRSALPDQTVEADDLGQQTPFGDARDQALNIDAALREWRLREIGPVFA